MIKVIQVHHHLLLLPLAICRRQRPQSKRRGRPQRVMMSTLAGCDQPTRDICIPPPRASTIQDHQSNHWLPDGLSVAWSRAVLQRDGLHHCWRRTCCHSGQENLEGMVSHGYVYDEQGGLHTSRRWSLRIDKALCWMSPPLMVASLLSLTMARLLSWKAPSLRFL